MMKYLLIVLTLLITLTTVTQQVHARTSPTAPQAPTNEKRFYGIWQKFTLTSILRKQAGVTVTAVPATPTPTKTPTKTPTPSPRSTTVLPQQSKTPTPTVKPATPTPTKRPITPTPTKTPLPTTAPAATNDVTAYIMKEINDYRASQGLSSVQTSKETCDFAKTRAEEISTNFSHDGFSQRRDNKTLPYANWTAITENIAMTSNYKDVVTMWKNSSGHAANMRANTPYVCVMQHSNYFAYEGMKP